MKIGDGLWTIGIFGLIYMMYWADIEKMKMGYEPTILSAKMMEVNCERLANPE